MAQKVKQADAVEAGEAVDEESGGLLSDPTVQRTLVEDPLLRFLKNWWQPIVIAVAVIFLGRYLIDQFQEYRVGNLRQGADVYHNVRTEYEHMSNLRAELRSAKNELGTAAEDKKAEKEQRVAQLQKDLADAQAKFSQYLKSLSDTKAPYAGLVNIYRALDARANQDPAAAKDLLSATDWRGLKAESPDRFYAELSASLLARIQIDDPAQLKAGRDLLAALAQDGSYLNVPAALTLAQISETPEEKQQALDVLKKLLAAQPEQNTLVQPEIERLE